MKPASILKPILILFILVVTFGTLPLVRAQAPEEERLPSIPLPTELDRVLRDYEKGWQGRDAGALADLFTEDGFVLSPGRPPVRGRENIRRRYENSGGDLALRALSYDTQGEIGFIIGAYGREPDGPDLGKFTLTLRRVDGRWLIHSDMDNGNSR